MGWAGHLVRMAVMRNIQFCLESSKIREHFNGLKFVIDGNIKMDLN
jgi:hypothetical protein